MTIVTSELGRLRVLNLAAVTHITSAGNYCEIWCLDRKKHMHRCTLSQVDEQNLYDMVRISRQTIVNLQYIEEVNSELGRFSLVKLVTGEELRIGNAYRAYFLRIIESMRLGGVR